jgi:hypothetical protein
VLSRLREMATDLGIDKRTDFGSEVETIRKEGDALRTPAPPPPPSSPPVF